MRMAQFGAMRIDIGYPDEDDMRKTILSDRDSTLLLQQREPGLPAAWPRSPESA
jgi:hypothetical protein